ncbi:hypothetical protein J7L13_00350 [bacterium]|nr:hypothetical protein [bacterium]
MKITRRGFVFAVALVFLLSGIGVYLVSSQQWRILADYLVPPPSEREIFTALDGAVPEGVVGIGSPCYLAEDTKKVPKGFKAQSIKTKGKSVKKVLCRTRDWEDVEYLMSPESLAGEFPFYIGDDLSSFLNTLKLCALQPSQVKEGKCSRKIIEGRGEDQIVEVYLKLSQPWNEYIKGSFKEGEENAPEGGVVIIDDFIKGEARYQIKATGQLVGENKDFTLTHGHLSVYFQGQIGSVVKEQGKFRTQESNIVATHNFKAITTISVGFKGSASLELTNKDWEEIKKGSYLERKTREALQVSFDFCPKGSCSSYIMEEGKVDYSESTPFRTVQYSLQTRFEQSQTGTGASDSAYLYWTDLKTEREFNCTYNGYSQDLEHTRSYQRTAKLSLKRNLAPSTLNSRHVSNEEGSHIIRHYPAVIDIPIPVFKPAFTETIRAWRNWVSIVKNGEGPHLTGAGRRVEESGNYSSEIITQITNRGEIIVSPPSRKGESYDVMKGMGDRYWFGEISEAVGIIGERMACPYSIMHPKPVKAIPKNIIIFYLFGEENRSMTEYDQKVLSSFAKWATKKGASVVEYEWGKQIHSKEDFLEMLQNIPQGAWVIIDTHGSPEGIGVGDSGFVYWNNLQQALRKGGTRIDVLALGSCYGGRAPSCLAHKVLGSLGLGRVTEKFEATCFFGLSEYNPLTMTTGSLIETLKRLITQSYTIQSSPGNQFPSQPGSWGESQPQFSPPSSSGNEAQFPHESSFPEAPSLPGREGSENERGLINERGLAPPNYSYPGNENYLPNQNAPP